MRTRGQDPRELGLGVYSDRVVERLVAVIEPEAGQGETPLLPVLNRYKPCGSTAEVNFKTTRACVATVYSHVDQVVADTESWEQAAVFRLEQAAMAGTVACYARNDHLELAIPYEWQGATHAYFPDFLVRLAGEGAPTLLIEIKGHEDEQTRAKHEGAKRWIRAVNHWKGQGLWEFLVCRDPQRLGEMLLAVREAVGAAR